eukprot:UN11800
MMIIFRLNHTLVFDNCSKRLKKITSLKSTEILMKTSANLCRD